LGPSGYWLWFRGSSCDPRAERSAEWFWGFWVSRLAPARAEAVGAVDGLAARRAERDTRLVAAVRAGGAEHLARATVVAARAVAATGAGAADSATAVAGR